MARGLWIVGLSFALLVYGGWVVFFLSLSFHHKRLNTAGFFLLVGCAYIFWFTLQYLLVKIRNRPYTPPPQEDTKPVEIPRLL